MSQVIIAGDTSGTITLQAPAVSGSSVLTLPATTATLATLTTPSFATTIGVGAATASASGAGISFPATQSNSSDANTLDDYEEGTFTPTITSDAGSITTQSGAGKYTKVGNVVTVVLYVTLTNVGTASGGMNVAGLPFASVRAGSQGRSFTALVREDAQTGIFYTCCGVGGGTGGVFYTLATNGPPPWSNNYQYNFSETYLTT